MKIDGIYVSTAFGILPASNLALLVARNQIEGGSATKSFVFQEAVLVRDEGPPRALVSPVSLGGYLNFLRTKAKHYVISDPLKSLKRSLCFFLLTTQYEPAKAIIELLQGDAAEVLAAAKREAEVDALLEAVPPEIASTIVVTAASRRLAPEIVAYAQALIRPQAEDLARKMSDLIDVLYAGLN